MESHTAHSVAGTKTSVESQSGGFRKRFTSPITTATPRYMMDAAATAPPGLKRKPSPLVSASPETKVEAVTSVKATIT